MVRDFDFKLSRNELLKRSLMEDIDVILRKRSSCFFFSRISNFSPTNLVSIFISKCYENERTLGRLSFFDTSHSRIGRAGFSNSLKALTSDWNFDWLFMNLEEFKASLAAQFIRRL